MEHMDSTQVKRLGNGPTWEIPSNTVRTLDELLLLVDV